MPEPEKKKLLEGPDLQTAAQDAVGEDKSFVLDLRKPVPAKEGPALTSLTFRPPRGRDMLGLKFNKLDMTDGELLDVVARLTGVQPALLHEMCSYDVTRANVVAMLFLSGGAG